MRTILIALAAIGIAATADAETPAGDDAIHGAFGRMLVHAAVPLSAPAPATNDAIDSRFERWVNAAARGEMSSLELGFAHMLERAADVPPALPVRGERDALEVLVTTALQAQAQAQDAGVQQRAAL